MLWRLMMNQMKINGEELVFGLDIGTRNVVGTFGYRQGERFVVVAQEIREHQTRAMLDGQIHDINRVAATIADIRKTLQDKTGLQVEEVCIAAAGRVLKTMNVHVDMELDKERNVTKDDIGTLVSMGVEQAFTDFQEKNDTDDHFYCVGYSVVRYFLNGLWMGQPEHHKAKNIGADMIATFLPDDVVDGLYSAVELADLKVANLTLEPIAAIRVAIPEKFRLLNIAMIDIGAGTSDISITDDGSVIAFGMIPHAGDSLTELLARTCLIDFATAEKIKTSATEQDEIVYEDIMGIEQTITAKEVLAICQPEIDKMAKLTADTIKELNGGTSPSAVFIVGGGGKIKGFAQKIAQELELDPKRVALRGEEIMNNIDFPAGALKDSTIITPIGICLTYYEQNNNFIYITFNDSKVKLYDNSKLTVMDAAMQASFTRDGLFPRRGKELHYVVNGKNRVTKGEYGESAHVYLNGEEVNLNHSIRANDVVNIEASTLGTPAQEKISDLVDFNGKITLEINGEEMQLSKPVKVNGEPVNEDYLIQDDDVIDIAPSYTQQDICDLMGVSFEESIIYINGEKADENTEINNSDKIEVKNKKEIELQEIYEKSKKEAEAQAQKQAKKEAFREAVKEHTSKTDEPPKEEAVKEETTKEETPKSETTKEEAPKEEAKEEETTKNENAKNENVKNENVNEETSKDEAPKEETKEAKPNQDAAYIFKHMNGESDGNDKLLVIVNDKPIIMSGKETFTFVDIFDYIDFDTSKMQGIGIATLVNGKDAQYTQELHAGDKIEVYWKQR